MSDDEHIEHVEHVEYDDSDGELPKKESIISNERKSYEFPATHTEEKEQLMEKNSETITKLTQNNTGELQLNLESQQQINTETKHQQLVNQQEQRIEKENEENKKSVDHEEEQQINRVQQSRQENVEEIINSLNHLQNNQEVRLSKFLNQDIPQDVQIVKSQLRNFQNHKQQTIEILDQSKKKTDKQIYKQAVKGGSNLNNKTQMSHYQNEHENKAKEEGIHQNRSQSIIKQEQPVQQETNSILERAINEEKPLCQVNITEDRIKELEQYIQSQKKIQQHKNQPILHEVYKQKKDPPMQIQQIISQPLVEPVQLNKQEKVENHEHQNDSSLSEQKIKTERRGTKLQNEMVYTSVKGRYNPPPSIQQPAAQNAKACKCVIM